ncbi:murein biosynthesis integral membrane protein MurJ [Mycolicibacterium vaccae]|uniref:Integral membrane protein MviN n=1 Tax=Mycolicibacterium vaccae ATCC 25954 TaxID=1194972 RepID=K0UVZ8_MYCVA|nr:murein biosynthesis integral membrane protein MurJ [Mycolicibacterium vaccae]ANI43004.1 membrane protein [Mycolicibacterium vaccae 95051]EJZ06798.1 integral membrane protein MviN [Mycolicibacterium vaccae ATCC 25954]MCV7063134.1 murein biosynthesis integral membrane protein MurJ [Mycolicibacterium vaccae]
MRESGRDAGPHRPSPDRPPARAELSDSAVVSRSWGMAVATLVSRLTGFARIVLLAAILGAALSSAFTVANQLPNLIAALVLEATFTAIFVPVLARAERDDPDGGTAFVRRLLTLATTLLLVVTVVSTLAAPLLVDLMLGSEPLVNRPLTTAFAFLLLPQIIFYGLSSVFMAILNTRNIFGPPAWAPVVNNVVAILTLGLYVLVPGELSINPVEMGNAKLLVLGIGTTLGVVAQAAVLFVALRRERISLRPLWGIDDRLKKFGMMALAMVLYVLVSQVGLIVGNQVASASAASGPAIYNYTWLVLQLPFGIIGVTVLTVVMPRLSRNAAADDGPAVLADLSLATRLTMLTLIPIVAMMTVGGPAIGSALFAYGNFGAVDAGYLGMAITLSAFTLIPYALVLLQLRVFYARQEPWTPIVLILVITAVKIAASLAAPHLTDDPEMVAGYLGLANGLGFLAGAVVGHLLLRARLNPPGGRLLSTEVVRTILVTITASLAAGLTAHVVDQLAGLENLTTHWGAAGSLLRLLALGLVMVPIIAGVMIGGGVPDALAALATVRRRFGTGKPTVAAGALTYPDPSNQSSLRRRQLPRSAARGPAAEAAGDGRRKGFAVSDKPTGGSHADHESQHDSLATTRFERPSPDDFQPDVPESDVSTTAPAADAATTAIPSGPEPVREPTPDPAAPDDVHLVPGATVVDGRYRLLVFHGGPPRLQFWQALDTALDRQVALTFVDPDGTLPEGQVQEILDRTQRLSRIDMPGVARVLDVSRHGRGGLVVSEWIRGGSLAEVADTNPSPIGGARAIQSLAAAAEVAHRNGVALSIDHPGRIRVSIDGDVALAFPATLPDASPDDDIRGIGASLYALLVDRWPLPETGAPSGLEPADLDAAGQPVEPKAVDRDIPFQISAAAARAVEEGGGIRSAPTLLNLLQQATAIADRTDHIAPVDDPSRGAGDSAADAAADPEAEARRRKGLIVGLSAAGVIAIVAVILLGTALSRIFGDVGNGLGGDELGLNTPPSSSSEASPSESGSVVKPVGVTVFSPEGEADAPGQADLAIDGDPSTVWPIDTYSDAVPFPNFKNGVGLMLQLPEPTKLSSVTVNLNSTGTSVQIRSATSASPSSLDSTTALTDPTALKPGSNTIEISDAEPTEYVLVWVSTLGQVNGQSRSDIAEITLNGTS